MKPLLVVVTGPTASGKTELAIRLAERFGTEIVSADSRQIFRDLPIGTAAPSQEERSRAFHHLVGTHSLDAYYSASLFAENAENILKRIWEYNRIGIVCGGSMMYIDALVNGIDDMPTVSESTRAYVLSLLEEHGLEGVLAQLRICDPAYYEEVDKANTRRVVHALEICLQAGVPYSTFRTGTKKERPFEVLKFAIDMPREVLFERINMRVLRMMEAGLIEEARAAMKQGNFNSLNTVGYKELVPYFSGEVGIETTIARIQKNTRVYAKKQLTWLRRDPSVIWLDYENAFAIAEELISQKL